MKLGHDNWIQIPCAPRYEINGCGDVRNIKTGYILKPLIRKNLCAVPQFYLYIGKGGKARTFHQTALLWLTHGKIPKRKTHSRLVVPVIVSRGGESYWFESCRQAAKFLAEREQYSVSHAVTLLAFRREEIFGWRINYQR